MRSVIKINKEMAEHLLRWHLDYETTSEKNKDLKDAYILIRYLLKEIEELKEIMNK